MSGLADIKAKIEHLGLGGATVDLGCGSVDAQPSEGGESREKVNRDGVDGTLPVESFNSSNTESAYL